MEVGREKLTVKVVEEQESLGEAVERMIYIADVVVEEELFLADAVQKSLVELTFADVVEMPFVDAEEMSFVDVEDIPFVDAVQESLEVEVDWKSFVVEQES